jgi:hypothetical protein
MTKSLWDERYGRDNYAYGTEPNLYFKSFIDSHVPGRILLPGEGEGRNAVYAATKGWDADAIDQSSEGRRKALKLAEKKGVSIGYTQANLVEYDFGTERYDAIAMIFFHLHRDIRQSIHLNLIKSLNPGGLIMIEAFSKAQLGKSSGGPQEIELLYDTRIFNDDFGLMKIEELYEISIILDEGPFHQGEASVIRMIARK